MELLQEIFETLKKFDEGLLEGETFVQTYLKMWFKLRDVQYEAIDKMGFSDELKALDKRRFLQEIDNETYLQQNDAIIRQITDLEVPIGSKNDKLLGHLFVEASEYSEDPEYTDGIGIDELHQVVKETLSELEIT